MRRANPYSTFSEGDLRRQILILEERVEALERLARDLAIGYALTLEPLESYRRALSDLRGERRRRLDFASRFR